ncbi:MAG: OmpA family protein, partial [Bacteroidota bacterium]
SDTPDPVVPPVDPRPEPLAPEAAPPTVEEIERDILDTGLFRTTYVLFAFAKSNLLPVSERTLNAVATVLQRYPELRIEIGGHTDNVGSDATNDRLSGERAAAAAAYLVASGVASDRLRAVGYGERLPVASNETDTGRALNRRVEFVVLNPEAGQRLR